MLFQSAASAFKIYSLVKEGLTLTQIPTLLLQGNLLVRDFFFWMDLGNNRSERFRRRYNSFTESLQSATNGISTMIPQRVKDGWHFATSYFGTQLWDFSHHYFSGLPNTIPFVKLLTHSTLLTARNYHSHTVTLAQMNKELKAYIEEKSYRDDAESQYEQPPTRGFTDFLQRKELYSSMVNKRGQLARVFSSAWLDYSIDFAYIGFSYWGSLSLPLFAICSFAALSLAVPMFKSHDDHNRVIKELYAKIGLIKEKEGIVDLSSEQVLTRLVRDAIADPKNPQLSFSTMFKRLSNIPNSELLIDAKKLKNVIEGIKPDKPVTEPETDHFAAQVLSNSTTLATQSAPTVTTDINISPPSSQRASDTTPDSAIALNDVSRKLMFGEQSPTLDDGDTSRNSVKSASTLPTDNAPSIPLSFTTTLLDEYRTRSCPDL